MDSTNITLLVGDDRQDRQYRTILHFDTASLPDGAVIASATLKIRQHSIVGTNPFLTHGNILVDIRTGAFSGSNNLQLNDFKAAASKGSAAMILNAPVNTWYKVSFYKSHFVYINKVGPTQFRLRFQADDNDDTHADHMRFYSGNHGTESVRPELVIKYYLP